MWVAVRDRLPTIDCLRSWGLNIPSKYLLCGTEAETRNHILFRCAFSCQVWSSFFGHLDLSPPNSFDDIVNWVRSSSTNPKHKLICHLIFQAAADYIWKKRNSRLHTSVSKTIMVLVKEIQLIMRTKLSSLDREASLIQSQSSSSTTAIHYQESFICT